MDKPHENYIIDDREAGLFRVNRRVFTDPACMDQEHRRIFEKCWIYVGHESEVPHAGDFRSRTVVGRPMILARGDDNVVRVMLNTCTHRGAMVCRQKAGNARTFQCPYHAWTFNSRGQLVGVPGEESYSDAFSRDEMALRSPAQVDCYRGFVFACFDPAGGSLYDYLAGAREYLDLVADQSEVGMKVVAGQQSYSARANWKLLVENSYDGYHGLPTHQRYFTFLTDIGVDMKNRDMSSPPHQKPVDLGNGHAVVEYQSAWGRPIAHWVPPFGEHRKAHFEEIRRKFENRFGKERAFRICETSRNLGIFPNLVINDIMAVTIRTFYPVSPDYMEVNAWALAPIDESAEDSALRLDNFLTFLGPGGFATPDDVEMLETCQRGFRNREVEWSDISRGMKREHPSITDELQMRAFWRRWNQLMTEPQIRRARRAA
ncbi:MAG TPA: aromatic ring-hydroxylating dioxygenase subunit alpha [Candidatus Binataceae bacterium]|nr:aromatic ring-hydroxylating dioxygenase subunit alpha [Candidatus Binataceae bacterium]